MGVKRGAWEKFRRGNVWRPGMLAGGIPALSMGDALRQRARAARGKGQSPWLGVADDIMRGLAGFALKIKGVKDQQRAAWDDAAQRMEAYEVACATPNSGVTYDPTQYKQLVEARDRAKAVYESWGTAFGADVSVNGLTFEDARDCILATDGLSQKTIDQINTSTAMAPGIEHRRQYMEGQ